jgi:hypothetical protein
MNSARLLATLLAAVLLLSGDGATRTLGTEALEHTTAEMAN